MFVVTGIALSGNKGAAAMALALIQGLERRVPGARFALFTYYPRADREWVPRALAGRVTLIDAGPVRALLRFPLLLWAGLARRLRLPRALWRWGAAVSALDGASAFLDASGISFVDGRERFLPFNLLVTLPGVLLGVPTIKVSQALGPFHNPLNRAAARLVLPRLELICARGEATERHLRELGLANVARYPDVTFSYQLEDDAPAPALPAALQELRAGGGELIGVSPSQVVHAACRKRGIPYLPLLRDFVVRLLADGSGVVVLAHSARRGSTASRVRARHNNDLPVVAELRALLEACGATADPRLLVIADELSPSALRRLIGGLDLLVASRLHAVVGALCMGTPTLVMGWSHKYGEILAAFDQERFALDYGSLDAETLWRGLESLRRERAHWLTAHGDALARERERSERFFEDLLERIGPGSVGIAARPPPDAAPSENRAPAR